MTLFVFGLFFIRFPADKKGNLLVVTAVLFYFDLAYISFGWILFSVFFFSLFVVVVVGALNLG